MLCEKGCVAGNTRRWKARKGKSLRNEKMRSARSTRRIEIKTRSIAVIRQREAGTLLVKMVGSHLYRLFSKV